MNNQRKSNRQRILELLFNNPAGVTGKDIFRELGITEYRKPIQRLIKEDGYDIPSEYETAKNRTGAKTTYKRWKLSPGDRSRIRFKKLKNRPAEETNNQTNLFN